MPEQILMLWLGSFVFSIWGIADTLTQPDVAWREIHKDKAVWVLIQCVFGIVGTGIYFFTVRPQLKRAADYHGTS